MKIYLCGSVAGRSAREMREERQAAAAAIRIRGWVPIDPIAGEYEALKRKRRVADSDAGLSATSVVRKDQYQIDQADILLWLTADISSYGSCIEVGYCWAKNTTVVAIDASKHGRKSAFVAHCCAYIADDLEDALEFIEDYMAIAEGPES